MSEPGRAVYQRDDLHAVLTDVPPGAATVCVVPLAGDLRDPEFLQRLAAETDDLELVCKVIDVAATPAHQVIVISTQPARRLAPR
jgi:hypothetical protein